MAQTLVVSNFDLNKSRNHKQPSAFSSLGCFLRCIFAVITPRVLQHPTKKKESEWPFTQSTLFFPIVHFNIVMLLGLIPGSMELYNPMEHSLYACL
ncbi:hypothetical protein J2S09_001277 [Bacillus fengqiuensis]|nr:hypothetical protein [Bacillus fengqiuensis]